MNNKIDQNIKTGATGNTIIGEQNIYGLTPEQASNLALQLFLENFPKLKEEAMQIVTQRVETFCDHLVKKIAYKNGGNFSEFASPDMQYMLVQAETDYARFGTEELLANLTDLVCKRARTEQSSSVKIILNKAIETVKYFTAEQLDFLSIIFYAKHVRIVRGDGNNDKNLRLKHLQNMLNNVAKTFSNADINSLDFLQTYGCLQLSFGNSVEVISEINQLNKTEVTNILPKIFNHVPEDYGLTLVGKALAIANIESRQNIKLDMSIWIS